MNSPKGNYFGEQAAGPHHILALLAGQAIRPYFIMEVSRDKIVEDVARILRSAEATALHLPLKVKFAGEDGQDEGGVRREFFQVLIRRLFDESYSMFTHDPDSHATWLLGPADGVSVLSNFLFPKRAMVSSMVIYLLLRDEHDTDELFKVCGTVIGLAVYNNEHGIEIHFPLAMFKKLKGEELGLADLQDIKPKVWMSLEQLLSWQPTTGDPNKEFEEHAGGARPDLGGWAGAVEALGHVPNKESDLHVNIGKAIERRYKLPCRLLSEISPEKRLSGKVVRVDALKAGKLVRLEYTLGGPTLLITAYVQMEEVYPLGAMRRFSVGWRWDYQERCYSRRP
eukprot:s3092_g1.t1